MDKKILYIDKEAFIDWFFDEDMIETFVYDQGVMSELKETGTFTLKIEDPIVLYQKVKKLYWTIWVKWI